MLFNATRPWNGTWQGCHQIFVLRRTKIHQREKVHRPSCHSFSTLNNGGPYDLFFLFPRAPSSPACGLRPSTAMVGLSMAKSMQYRLSSKTFIFSEPFLWLFEQSPLIVAGGWWPNLHAIDHSPWAWGHWCQKGFKYSVWTCMWKTGQFHRRLVDGCRLPDRRSDRFQIKPLFQSPFWHSGLLLRWPCPGLCLHCLPNNWVHWFFLPPLFASLMWWWNWMLLSFTMFCGKTSPWMSRK